MRGRFIASKLIHENNSVIATLTPPLVTEKKDNKKKPLKINIKNLAVPLLKDAL